MLLVEAFVYNTSGLALFSCETRSLCSLWQQTRVVELLEQMNPEGPDRIAKSSLLAGEYGMYALILAVTCLHRCQSHEFATPRCIDQLMARLNKLSRKCQERFEAFGASRLELPSLRSLDVMFTIHQMPVSALSLCMEALRGDSPRAGKAVDALASRLMDQFLSIKRFDICLAFFFLVLIILHSS